MKKQEAEQIVMSFVKPVFGFALKRCKTQEDAEDLSQDIILRAFRALLSKNDIVNADKFIWTIAHNTLHNYYRDRAKAVVGVSVDEVAQSLADPKSILADDDRDDVIDRLRSEIAYLSNLQRRIVIAYYFEKKKQSTIADLFGIPLGTVKWHLFEAKKELKRGMTMTRHPSDLKFHPITFSAYGINGSVGKKSLDEFFRSALSQNICYAVRNEAKSIHDIADALGVSPVYVEPEVLFLEEYGFLREQHGRYLADFIIDEPTPELLQKESEMYHQAAASFADELFDTLQTSGILDDTAIVCEQTDGEITHHVSDSKDHNFLLWSLIPYIAANAGKSLMDTTVSFEEVATYRPDGAHNICHACVMPDRLVYPEQYIPMTDWCGPSWTKNDFFTLWRTDSEWSGRRIRVNEGYYDEMQRVLFLYGKAQQMPLDREEYVWLAERGFVKIERESETAFRVAWQIVLLRDREIVQKLLAVGEQIKKAHLAEWDAIKAPYVEALLASVPEHLRSVARYELQFTFHSDGRFLLHCLHHLLKNGKLRRPTADQALSMMTLIAPV